MATHNRLKSDCTPSSLSAILESATIHLTSFAAVSGTSVTSLSGFSNHRLKWDIDSVAAEMKIHHGRLSGALSGARKVHSHTLEVGWSGVFCIEKTFSGTITAAGGNCWNGQKRLSAEKGKFATSARELQESAVPRGGNTIG